MLRNIVRHAPAAALTPSILLACAAPAAADDAFTWSVAYTADIIAGESDDVSTRGRYLDNLDIVGDVDLEQTFGWRGMTLHGHLLNNAGQAPNDDLGTLQGVDNIEVASHRGRLFELWVEKAWDRGSVRGGLYDLNSEFYANESAGLLIAPAFGIGSELAATGPNGPSIFPSTALALRGRLNITEHSSVMLAALNAHAGVLGDPDGVDTSFDDGALLIGEYEWRGPVRFSAGVWGYTDEQDDVRDTDGLGDPLQQRSYGGYVTLEGDLREGVTGFARVGFSDGDTTSFEGGWQAGVLIAEPFGHSAGQLSFGAYQGLMSGKHRANETDLGVDAARAETGLEITYSAQLAPWLRVQPDLQYVIDPGADSARDDLFVFGLRLEVTPFAHD